MNRFARALRRLLPSREEFIDPAPAPAPPRYVSAVDPLDPQERHREWTEGAAPLAKFRSVDEFAIEELTEDSTGTLVARSGRKWAMDATATARAARMVVYDDDACGGVPCGAIGNLGTDAFMGVPPQLANWYMSQGFIGYQSCAIIAQHWLVDKACSMGAEDAVRNGWELKADGGDDMSDDHLNRIRDADIKMKISEQLREFVRFRNIFGIRVALFDVEYDDPEAYTKPFNVDGITPGSYKGVTQVDPYWMMPVLKAGTSGDPRSRHFYEPDYWQINGTKYHRSHLIISRGPQPADILKPTYIFGGVPLTQRIYERVYAAERTANEAPLLSVNKRTTALHVDLEKVATQQGKFEKRLLQWIRYRDNHAVKVLGKDETMEQFDTSLTDFDSVIMNQYQIVAAIARVPSTKLLGTSPKGFNATGEFEMKSYHEELEAIQENDMTPLLDRHYLLLAKSEGIDVGINVSWNAVDSLTAKEQAEINKTKADTGQVLISAGALSPDDERTRLRDDKDSGYNRLNDEEAEEEPGMSPENQADLTKADKTGAAPPGVPGGPPVAPAATEAAPAHLVGAAPIPAPPALPAPPPVAAPAAPATLTPEEMFAQMADVFKRMMTEMVPEGQEFQFDVDGHRTGRSTMPSTQASIRGGTSGMNSLIDVHPGGSYPKMKVNGMLLSIENPRGTIRSGRSLQGDWRVRMPHHYGYINGTKGADGQEVDCFVGPNLKSPRTFVINQRDINTDEFDEHKVMIGFDSPEEAKNAYNMSYGNGWDGFMSMREVGLDEFKQWLAAGDCTIPHFGGTVMDEGKWEEEKHPRGPDGKFGKGGGGGTQGTVKPSAKVAAKPGSKMEVMTGIAAKMLASGKVPTKEEFHAALTEAGYTITPEQGYKYLKIQQKAEKEAKAAGSAIKPAGESESGFKTPKPDTGKPEEKSLEQMLANISAKEKEALAKKQEASNAEPPKQEEAPKAPEPLTPAAMSKNSATVGTAASTNGYKPEGTYNGINYYKDAAGKKVSYKPDSDSWVAIEGGKIIAQGNGTASFENYVEKNKGKAPEPGTMAASPVSVHHTATEKAKAYGDKMSHESQSFASSGIANETALPSQVKNSILAYKGSSYTSINDAMRFNSSFDPNKMEATTMAHILNLNRAFAMVAPSKNDVTVGRKVGLEALRTMVKDAGISDLDHLKPGDVLRDPGIVSTSHSANVWHGDVRFEIKIPKGSKAIDISETIKKNQSEQEVLLGPDTKLKISGVKKGGEAGHYKYHITCEVA